MNETIVARATPPGIGGIGVVRISGTDLTPFIDQIIGCRLQPRVATYVTFRNKQGQAIDQGIALYFEAPYSFTGENVLELQGHGGDVVVDLMIQAVLELGARMAQPGEFSQRAFLNNKIDLAQAEAIADLISATTEKAARCALQSLQGEFSKRIHILLEALISIRLEVEAAIDFPDEDIEFIQESRIVEKIEECLKEIKKIRQTAYQGTLLREGLNIVIIGEPNVGKSSLMNCLSGRDCAIVTDIPGTTRDILRESIHLDGIPLHIFDTAGIREETNDIVEIEGIRRAKAAIAQADLILLMQELVQEQNENRHIEIISQLKLPKEIPKIIIENKIDLLNLPAQQFNKDEYPVVRLSAKHQTGIDLLRGEIKKLFHDHCPDEGQFIARRRHLFALDKTGQYLENALHQWQHHKASELLAEELKQAQEALGQITGTFTTEDLLGRIFSSFCIGK